MSHPRGHQRLQLVLPRGPHGAVQHGDAKYRTRRVHWAGLGHLLGGGALMLMMMLARHRLTWWPIHPIGFPISGIFLIKILWANVFIAWAIKCLMLRFGGASAYRRSHRFFLGLIVGETLCNGIWLVIDYFTGAIGNRSLYVAVNRKTNGRDMRGLRADNT